MMRSGLRRKAAATGFAVLGVCAAALCGWSQPLTVTATENGLAAPPAADVLCPIPLTSAAKPVRRNLIVNITEDLGDIALAPVSIRSNHMLLVIPSVAAVMLVKNDELDFYARLHEPRNKTYDSTMPVLTSLGDGVTLLALCSGLYALGGEREHQAADLSIEALADTGVTVAVLKAFFAASRPSEDPDEHRFFDYSHNLLHAGFPSGHTAAAFAFATVIGRSYHAEVPAYLLATGVGFSRIYLSAHWPSDVLSGALVGTLIGNFVLERRTQPAASLMRVGPMWMGGLPAVGATVDW